MYPRLSIDIPWHDLVRGLGYCLRASGDILPPVAPAARSEAMVTLSVRSTFDLLLAALELPTDSEVLLSEVTVPHMERIVREHGLVPVAVPVDPRTLAVAVEQVEARRTERTRVLVAAHLFGARMPLEALGRWCREHKVLLVEDCAQALVSGLPGRDSAADVSLYSFGPIKTATALGGGLALVGDPELRERMTRRASRWPRHTARGYAVRLAKMAGLKLLSQRWLFTPMVGLMELAGGDADAFVGHSARGFPNHRLLESLRQRPCPALERLIARRLRHFDPARIADRARRGRHLAKAIAPAAFAAGCDNPTHTYWVFPAVCREPQAAVAALRAAGFDASRISGLAIVGNPPPDHWFCRTVFIPHGPQVPERQLERISTVVRSCG